MTVGIPIAITFATVLTKGQPITITAEDQNGLPVTPVGLTFSVDGLFVDVAVDPADPFTFWLNGVSGSPTTAAVTFTDAAGDTVVVTATTTEAVTPIVTLIATAGTAV